MNMKKNLKFKLYILPLVLFWSMWFAGCNKEEQIGIVPPLETGPGVITGVITTADGNVLLQELPKKIGFTDQKASSLIITVDETKTLQTIEGFGAALTGSSAVLLNTKQEALETLFGDQGIRLNYGRLTVGASDFNKNQSYTYNDTDGSEDLTLSNFSITMDRMEDNPVIPVAKAIMAINPSYRFMASPWSPPAWMKTNKALNGGGLDPKYYDVYADYLIKYIEEYKNEGIPINAVTVQNEPLHETSSYPSMKMTAAAQTTFIGQYLGPKLAATDLETKIIAYDHNYLEAADPEYPMTVLGDVEASKYTNAVGYHAYAGEVGDVADLISKFPNAEIYFTEQSGIQNDNTSFEGELKWFMQNVFIGMLRQGAKSILLWNLALDESAGPKNGGCKNCRGVLKLTRSGAIIKNVEYYMLGHFSKYVDTGAQVIATNSLPSAIENVAFRNPDGSKVLVVFNSSGTGSEQLITVAVGAKNFSYSIPKGALVTFKWK